MRRYGMLLAVLLCGGACTRTVVGTSVSPAAERPVVGDLGTPPSGTWGATSSRGAVDSFLAAAKKQDLRGMSAVWGNDRSPAATRFPREEIEKRLIIMQCALTHDQATYVEDRPRLLVGGRQVFLVALTQGRLRAQTKFTTVAGPDGHWFVETFDLEPLKDFCH